MGIEVEEAGNSTLPQGGKFEKLTDSRRYAILDSSGHPTEATVRTFPRGVGQGGSAHVKREILGETERVEIKAGERRPLGIGGIVLKGY